MFRQSATIHIFHYRLDGLQILSSNKHSYYLLATSTVIRFSSKFCDLGTQEMNPTLQLFLKIDDSSRINRIHRHLETWKSRAEAGKHATILRFESMKSKQVFTCHSNPASHLDLSIRISSIVDFCHMWHVSSIKLHFWP